MAPVDRRRFLVGGAVVAVGAGVVTTGYARLSSLRDYNAMVAQTRAHLSDNPGTTDLIRFATLASNSHNTQPWRFSIGKDRIGILPDFTRRIPIVDPDDHHLFVSLGCAAENLALASAAHGRPGDVAFDAERDRVEFTYASASAMPSELFDAIPHCQSTRADYDGRPVAPADLRRLVAAAAVPGVEIALITERAQIEHVGALVAAGNSAQLADRAFVRELKSWLRFNPDQAMQARDGLFTAASGNPVVPTFLGPFLFDRFFDAATENTRYIRQLRSSAAVVVFTGDRADRDHWVRCGRACQRFALQATALGLKHAFINQPVEVPRLRPELASIIGLPGRRPDIVMRLGYGHALPFSARRAANILAES